MLWCEGSRRASDATPQASGSKGCGCRVAPSRHSLSLHGRRERRARAGKGGAAGATAVRNFGEPVPCGRYLSQWLHRNHDTSKPPDRIVRCARCHIKFLRVKLRVERVQLSLPAVCACPSRGARAPHPPTPSPRTPHTATRPDHATRSPRPLDALTATTRLHTLSAARIGPDATASRVGGDNDSRRRAGSAMPGATHAHGRDAYNICTPHMHTKQTLLAQGRETRRLLIGVLRREGPVPRVT